MPTETLRPNADGTASGYEWYPSTGSTRWNLVSDDSDLTYMYTIEELTPRISRFYKLNTGIPDLATNITVTVRMRCKREYDNPSYKAPVNGYQGLYIGSTDYYSPSFNPTDSYANYDYTWNTNPAGGNWTKADINNMQIDCKGISNRRLGLGFYWWSYINCSEVYLIIGYTVPGQGRFFQMFNI